MKTDQATLRRLGLVTAIAIAIVVTAAWFWSPAGPDDPSTAGQSDATSPDCGPVVREPTAGAGDHLEGPVTYDAAPPSFGDHAPRWEVRALNFYDAQSRPDVSVLVHNLEHGYNILWYDESVIDDPDALARVQQIATQYASAGRAPEPDNAFIAAPWTAEDGTPFPDGMNYALTHWYADPQDRTFSRADEEGLTRYCADISPDVVEDWMTRFPLRDAPEGFPDLM